MFPGSVLLEFAWNRKHFSREQRKSTEIILLYRHLCKMGQTRVFAASIMMFRERVRRTSSYNRRLDMGTKREPRKESNKATLARIKKEMAQPRIVKSAIKGASTRQDSQ